MKKFLILFFAAITLTACDWNDDPQILGYSEIKQSEDGEYICQVNNFYCYIDSVLTKENGIKCYEEPILGEDVTAFTLDKNDEIYFYKGHVSSEEIKEVYFQYDDSNLPEDGDEEAEGKFALCVLGVISVWFFCAADIKPQ